MDMVEAASSVEYPSSSSSNNRSELDMAVNETGMGMILLYEAARMHAETFISANV
jgi:hypothetical protein